MNESNLRTILDELGIEIASKTAKKWIVCSCPFAPFLHDKSVDRSPSFNVKVNERGTSGFYCFTCHRKGRISRLVNQLAYYRDDDYSHLALLAETMEIPEEFPDFEEDSIEDAPVVALDPQVYAAMYPLATEDSEAVAFLKRRGVSRKAAELLQLQFDPDACRVLFPVRDYKGDLLGFSGRSIIPDHRRRKDVPKVKDYAGLKKAKVILAENLIRSNDLPILVVEGLIATARMMTIGARALCDPCATLGSSMSVAQRDILVSYDKPVVMLYDNDSAGTDGLFGNWNRREERHEGGGAIDLLREHVPVGIARYPKGVDDPDNLTPEQLNLIMKKGIDWQ